MRVNAPGASSVFRAASLPPGANAPSRWHGTALGADHAQKVTLRKLRQVKFEPGELEGEIRRLLAATDATEERQDGFKWVTLIELKDAVARQAPDVPIAGRDKAAYEQLFRCEPGRYMAKPRFLIAMRKVYGFKVAETECASDGATLRLLERCYRAFDPFQRGEFDWRVFLFMYRCVSLPLTLLTDNLFFAFGLYASSGSYDWGHGGGGNGGHSSGHADTPLPLPPQSSSSSSSSSSAAAAAAAAGPSSAYSPYSVATAHALKRSDAADKVPFGALRGLFEGLAFTPLRPLLLDMVDTAWLELGQESLALNMELSACRRRGVSTSGVSLTRSLFGRLLDMPALAPLFEAAHAFGPCDPAVWTLVAEEHFLDPRFLAFLKPQRRAVNGRERAVAFRRQFAARYRKRLVGYWKGYVLRRQRCRFLVCVQIARYKCSKCLGALRQWRACAMQLRCVVLLQAVLRGWMGRLAGWYRAQLEVGAVLLQTRYRGMRAKRRYFEVVARRHWAATEIGRFVRGAAAKRLGLYKLETRVFEGRQALRRERFRFENKVLVDATVRLQRNWRAKQRGAAAAAAAAREARQEAMGALLVAAQAEAGTARKVYEAELVRYFQNEKRKALGEVSDEELMGARKMDINRLRRKEAAREQAAKDAARAAQASAGKEAKVGAWLAEWEAKAADAKALCMEDLARILASPLGAAEEKERERLRKEIRLQARDVLDRADKAGMRMEEAEARQIAGREVISLHGDAAYADVKAKMREAAAAEEVAESEDAERAAKRAEREEYLKQGRSATLFQRAFRKWLGRKLLRLRTYLAFEKRFLGGARGFGFEYVDLRSDEAQAHKPLLLGPRFDLALPDAWAMVPDKEGVPYYYNPGTLDMQWELPYGVAPCQQCKVGLSKRWEIKEQAGGKGRPPPRRSAFGAGGGLWRPKRKGLGRLLCVDCWEQAHPFGLGLPNNTYADRCERLRWVTVEGGAPTAAALLLRADDAALNEAVDFGELQCELDLGVRYANEHFGDDDSSRSLRKLEECAKRSAARQGAVRARMVRAEEHLADSPDLVREKHFVANRKKALQQRLALMRGQQGDAAAAFGAGQAGVQGLSLEGGGAGGGGTGGGGGGGEAWQEYTDEEEQPYWYNEATGETTYEDPRSGAAAAGDDAAALAATNGGGGGGTAGGSGGAWTEGCDDDGHAYWYNEATGEVAYEDPGGGSGGDGGAGGDEGGGGGELAEGYDEEGHANWYNEATGGRSYEDPYAGGGGGGGTALAAYGGGGYDNEVGDEETAEGAWCEECGEAAAVRACDDCGRSFCVECHMDLHRRGTAFSNHSFHNISVAY